MIRKLVVHIKEDAWLAKLAAKRMRSSQMAMVVGCTIYLHGVSRQGFLSDAGWMRHEVCHVYQYRQYGILRFLWLYWREFHRHGYYQNAFEIAAREAENDPELLKNIDFAPKA
ncbi:hypothetical protein GA0116948_10647 [Chitinophaga costaii]|uniref:DUF4157 domain-containing protein n=1 Tax=Chitinophaga costaii TaxID=1335309 RepID=A0A1C4DQC6_9BACT|nr:hypothetical protein [Chitinophaga costaii]PUZ27740.1 DUF4157 domain-containing protein [Chitinophaga costaii]SCC33604.1 hypothetical protein GA0116948_10647 [Chitinophaga costaii]